MAFVFSKTTPTTGAVAMFNLKELLKTAGWTVMSSSDGTTYNAGGDQISSGAAGANGMANNNAWFRIRSPAGAGAVEYIFQRGTTNLVWRGKRSRTAGFTGGSPSATQTPSATDEGTFLGGGTDAAPTFAGFHTTDNTYRWNVGADNASPYGWWAGAFTTGGGAIHAVLAHDPLTGTEPTDADQFMGIMACTGQSGYSNAHLTSEVQTATTRFCFSQAISAAPAAGFLLWSGCTLHNNIQNALVAPTGLPTNPITTKDEVFPIVWARRSALATPGYKGVSTIMKWTGTTRTTGDTLSVSSTRDRIIYGDVSLPWDGTVPTV